MTAKKLIFLGVGRCATWVAKLGSSSYELYGTTRDVMKASMLLAQGIQPIIISPWLDQSKQAISDNCKNSDVLVSFPPGDEMDEKLAPLCREARSIIYISSTGVYGTASGLIDEDTEVDNSVANDRSNERLKAEQTWRNAGASILRAPGLYDCESGLHRRLLAGTYKLPGNGNNFVSRIHLKDLARIILACFAKPLSSCSLYVVGDLKPSTHNEVVTWLCDHLKIPFPESAPLDAVAPTLRGNRQISPKRILNELAITLEYPTYQDGYADCLKSMTTTVSS